MQSVYDENWGDAGDGGRRRKKGERDLNQAGDERALLCASSCILDLRVETAPFHHLYNYRFNYLIRFIIFQFNYFFLRKKNRLIT